MKTYTRLYSLVIVLAMLFASVMGRGNDRQRRRNRSNAARVSNHHLFQQVGQVMRPAAFLWEGTLDNISNLPRVPRPVDMKTMIAAIILTIALMRKRPMPGLSTGSALIMGIMAEAILRGYHATEAIAEEMWTVYSIFFDGTDIWTRDFFNNGFLMIAWSDEEKNKIIDYLLDYAVNGAAAMTTEFPAYGTYRDPWTPQDGENQENANVNANANAMQLDESDAGSEDDNSD